MLPGAVAMAETAQAWFILSTEQTGQLMSIAPAHPKGSAAASADKVRWKTALLPVRGAFPFCKRCRHPVFLSSGGVLCREAVDKFWIKGNPCGTVHPRCQQRCWEGAEEVRDSLVWFGWSLAWFLFTLQLFLYG